MYPPSSSQSQWGENEHQTVAVHDGRGDALVDGVRHDLSGQAVPVPVKLQPVGKVLGLPDELHDGEELLVVAALLLLRQLQREEEAKVGLHHHLVHHTRQGLAIFQDLAKFR